MPSEDGKVLNLERRKERESLSPGAAVKEIQNKMVLSAAEKQRRYRARRYANPIKRDQYLQRKCQKWQEKKKQGK
ncbi:UNVERIFIED_CONTAM: hypothetical protein FKN15_072792 [Acipenser sinensis]